MAAVAPVLQDGVVTGVSTRSGTLYSKVLIDATGYRSTLLKQAGLDPGMRRFGVGAEYDLLAPHCLQGLFGRRAYWIFVPYGFVSDFITACPEARSARAAAM